jgi:hypothetical protein
LATINRSEEYDNVRYQKLLVRRMRTRYKTPNLSIGQPKEDGQMSKLDIGRSYEVEIALTSLKWVAAPLPNLQSILRVIQLVQRPRSAAFIIEDLAIIYMSLK